MTRTDANSVSQLQVAQPYRTGDVWDEERAQTQTNPLVVDGVLSWTSLRARFQRTVQR